MGRVEESPKDNGILRLRFAQDDKFVSVKFEKRLQNVIFCDINS